MVKSSPTKASEPTCVKKKPAACKIKLEQDELGGVSDVGLGFVEKGELEPYMWGCDLMSGGTDMALLNTTVQSLTPQHLAKYWWITVAAAMQALPLATGKKLRASLRDSEFKFTVEHGDGLMAWIPVQFRSKLSACRSALMA